VAVHCWIIVFVCLIPVIFPTSPFFLFIDAHCVFSRSHICRCNPDLFFVPYYQAFASAFQVLMLSVLYLFFKSSLPYPFSLCFLFLSRSCCPHSSPAAATSIKSFRTLNFPFLLVFHFHATFPPYYLVSHFTGSYFSELSKSV